MRLILLMAGLALVCGGDAWAQPRGGLGPFGEAGDIPGCILSDSFDAHPAYSVLPIDPKDDYSYFGLADGGYVSGLEGYGVVDNAAAISSATYNGPVGGPDPSGERGGMLHVQRASLGEQALVEDFEIKYGLYPRGWYFATPERPLFVTLDVYKNTHADFQWINQYGNVQLLRFFVGGHHFDSLLGGLAGLRGDLTLLEGAIVLGAIDEQQGAFFRSGKDIPERGWYTVGLLLTIDKEGFARKSVWLRDSETMGLGGAVSRTPVRTSGPLAGQRMFSEFDLGLDEGWVQIYPGTEDDPGTVDAIEGYGLAERLDGVDIIAAPYEDDMAGNRIGVGKYAQYYTYARVIVGGDPSQAQVPGYEIADWWVDNYCVRGGKRWPSLHCLADFNVDGVVDASDLAEMLAQWGVSQPLPVYPNQYAIALDGNTIVDSNDLAVLLAAWGACP